MRRRKKICTKCNKSLPIDNYWKHKNNPDGLQYWCKDCTKKYNNSIREKVVAIKCIDCNEIVEAKTPKKLRCDNCNRKYLQLLNKKYIYKRERNIIHNFTYDEWLDKLEKTNGYCPNCGKFVGIYALTLDHIIPINSVPVGTIYTIDDVEPLCLSCNSSKSDNIIINDIDLNNIFTNKTYEDYIKEARKLLEM